MLSIFKIIINVKIVLDNNKIILSWNSWEVLCCGRKYNLYVGAVMSARYVHNNKYNLYVGAVMSARYVHNNKYNLYVGAVMSARYVHNNKYNLYVGAVMLARYVHNNKYIGTNVKKKFVLQNTSSKLSN